MYRNVVPVKKILKKRRFSDFLQLIFFVNVIFLQLFHSLLCGCCYKEGNYEKPLSLYFSFLLPSFQEVSPILYDLFCKVTYCTKWIKTSWTYNIVLGHERLDLQLTHVMALSRLPGVIAAEAAQGLGAHTSTHARKISCTRLENGVKTGCSING